MQAAVDLVNNAITAFFDPEPLPKLDFSTGIPRDCATLVAVPSLLMNEKQVRKLANDLEVRFLGNRDRNLHFALLTDLPDSISNPHEKDSHPLVDLASRLIDELNAKISIATATALSCCCIAIAFTTCGRACGWVGSASAASCST